VVTFKDALGATKTATVTTNGTFTVDLSGLADGAITASMVATDTATNKFTANASNTATLDQDLAVKTALNLTITSPAINAETAPAVAFTIAGLEPEDTGTVTFTDSANKTVQVVVNGGKTSYTADLSSLADGNITSSLVVNLDAAGNNFQRSGNAATLTQIDHWTNTAGGDWVKTSSNWVTRNGTHALPTGSIDAYIDASGTYKVTIATNNVSETDTAYALVLSDTGGTATVSDNPTGTLTLWGAGGPSNPNGKLIIMAGGVFSLAGGTLNSDGISVGSGGTFGFSGGFLNSGMISVASGGMLNLSANVSQAIQDNGSLNIGANATLSGLISGSGAINVSSNVTATFNSALNGAETITIGNKGTIAISGGAMFSGSISGNGSFSISDNPTKPNVLEFVGAVSENVTFAGATGTLKLDHGLTAPYTGQITGLLTQTNFVDLADLTYVPNKMSATYSSAKGTLTVSNGTNSAKLSLAPSNYASWVLSQDSGTGTLIKDPSVTGSLDPDQSDRDTAPGLDFSDIAFGHDTTLAYAVNSDKTGGTLTVSDGLHAQSVALLGQYMASSFVMAGDGHVGTLITDPVPAMQPVLAQPHH
jgi:hypothetical protein